MLSLNCGIKLLFVLSSIFNVCLSSHWRYGQVSWKISTGTTVEFTAEIGWRSTFIGANTFVFGDGSTIFMSNVECSLMTTPCADDTSSQLYYEKLSDTVDLAGSPATLIKYIFYHTYSSTGPFTYSIGSCCRIGDLVAGDNDNFFLQGQVNMNNGNTGSPVSSISPILQFTLGVMNTFALNPVDNDGDVVTCSKASSTDSGITDANTYFDVDENTCEVTIMESGTEGDKWAAQIFMETANGDSIPLDFIFEGIDFEASPPVCTVVSSPAASGNFEVTANEPLVIDLLATDPDATATSEVTVNVISTPSGSIVDPVGNVVVGSGLDIEFFWIPSDTQIGSFSASIQIVNENSLTSLCTLPIFVHEDLGTDAPTEEPTNAPRVLP